MDLPSAMNFESKEARDLIAFYLDAGADAVIGEEPVDRMADEPKSAPPPEKAKTDPSPDRLGRSGPALPGEGRFSAPASPEAAIMAAREAAKNARTLDELRVMWASTTDIQGAIFVDWAPLFRELAAHWYQERHDAVHFSDFGWQTLAGAVEFLLRAQAPVMPYLRAQ